MRKKPNVAKGLKLILSMSQIARWTARSDVAADVNAAVAWIRSLPDTLTKDDLRAPNSAAWRKSLRESVERCLSEPGRVRTTLVVGHMTEDQKQACLEELQAIASKAGLTVRAVGARGKVQRLTLQKASPRATRARAPVSEMR